MNSLMTSIKRTPYQSLAAFLVLFFTLSLSTALFMGLSFLYGFLGYVETKPQVSVYFQPKTAEGDIFKVRDMLMNSGKVASLKYVSKEDAYKIYKESNKDNPLLLEMISADILPPSLEINAKEPAFLPELDQMLKNQPNVNEVQFQKDLVDRLLSLTTILRRITMVLFIYLLLMSIVVLTTTTLFKIALKKDEIELLRLLGATDFYIKKPFLQEALFFGLSAATFSFLLVLIILLAAQGGLTSYLRGVNTLTLNLLVAKVNVWPINPIFLLLTFVLSAAFGVGMATSATHIATKKYLSK